MNPYHKTFSGESEDAVKTAPENSGLAKVQLSNLTNISISQYSIELWFGQGSAVKSDKCINITNFFQVKVTMPVKTAPENSGLVKVQRSNLKKISISQIYFW